MSEFLQERIGVDTYVVPLVFQFTDVPDSTGTLATVQATTTDYIMPWGGSVIAIGASSNAAFTTGTITFRAVVAGTASTAITVALSSSAQRNTVTKSPSALRFLAGQRLGMDFTKSGTVDPVTNDISATLWVVLRPIEL